jgi:hypothetical protein
MKVVSMHQSDLNKGQTLFLLHWAINLPEHGNDNCQYDTWKRAMSDLRPAVWESLTRRKP